VKTIKKIFVWIIVAISFFGIIIFVIWLKQSGKSIQIKPEFKIVDSKKEDTDFLSESIDVAKNILERMV